MILLIDRINRRLCQLVLRKQLTNRHNSIPITHESNCRLPLFISKTRTLQFNIQKFAIKKGLIFKPRTRLVMHLAKCLFLEAFNTVEFPFLLSARSSKRTSIILILHKISKYGTNMCPLTENVVKGIF